MFDFTGPQKKRRHRKALNYDLTEKARTTRKDLILEKAREKRAARAAALKRKRTLTVTVRGVRVKQKKFKDAKKAVLKELRSWLASVKKQEAKFKEIGTAFEIMADKFADMTEGYTNTTGPNDVDFSALTDVLENAIDELLEVES